LAGNNPQVQATCRALYASYEEAEEVYVGPDFENVFMDNDGRIRDPDALRRSVFYHGVDPHARPLVWKFLLGYYPYDSTRDERDALAEERCESYTELKNTWCVSV
jgi:hypothetical protein